MSAKAAVLVPCFNEEVNIPSVVATLKKHVPEMDIIIINDCSTDHTAAVAAAAELKPYWICRAISGLAERSRPG